MQLSSLWVSAVLIADILSERPRVQNQLKELLLSGTSSPSIVTAQGMGGVVSEKNDQIYKLDVCE